MNNYKVKEVISCNFQILKNDPETSAIFTDNPLTSFRRNKNIRDNLVRSALRQNLQAPGGTFSCSRSVRNNDVDNVLRDILMLLTILFPT